MCNQGNHDQKYKRNMKQHNEKCARKMPLKQKKNKINFLSLSIYVYQIVFFYCTLFMDKEVVITQ